MQAKEKKIDPKPNPVALNQPKGDIGPFPFFPLACKPLCMECQHLKLFIQSESAGDMCLLIPQPRMLHLMDTITEYNSALVPNFILYLTFNEIVSDL